MNRFLRRFASPLLLSLLSSLTYGQDPRSLGTLQSYPAHSEYLMAAPHGGFDLQSDRIAMEVAQAIGWNAVVANGFRNREHPFNVNRPSEGIGLPADQEIRSESSRIIYEQFRHQLFDLSRDPPLYVEVHGDSAQGLETRIEVATVGIDRDQACDIRDILQKHLTALFPDGPYSVAVEGVDPIRYKASASKKIGTLHDFKRVLHMEFPKKLRVEETAKVEVFLILALPEVAARLAR